MPDLRLFFEDHWKKLVAIIIVVSLTVTVFLRPQEHEELDLSKFKDPAVKPAELSFVKVSKHADDTEVRIVDKNTEDPIPSVKIAITDLKNHEGRYVAFAEDELRQILNQPKGDLVFYNRHDSEAKPRFLVEGEDYKVMDFQGEKVYVIRFEKFSTNTLIVQAWSGKYNVKFLNVTTGNFSLYLRGNITNATVTFAVKGGGSGTFDNSGGGSWQEYFSFAITTIPSEYAQYLIEINGTSWEIYSVDGVLQASGLNANFWNLVKSDGSDIRIFNKNGNQRYFYIKSFDYNAQTAIIEVRVEAGDSELNIAYGNPSANTSSYNDASMVFEFFDDFEDGDISDWTIYSGPFQLTTTHVYKGNYGFMKDLNAASDDAGKTFNYDRSYDITFEFAVKLIENAGVEPFGIILRDTSTNNGYLFIFGRSGTASKINLFIGGTSSTQLASGGSGIAAGTWYNSKITIKSDGTLIFEDGTGAVIQATDSTYSNFNQFMLRFYRSAAIDEIKAYKLADPADFGSGTIKYFSVDNPRIYINDNEVRYNGSLNASATLSIPTSYFVTGTNNITITNDNGALMDVFIEATYTDTINLTIVRELGSETQTFEYTPVENSTDVEVNLVFTGTDLYHQLWGVTVNGNSWTNYNWSYPHLTIYLGNTTANTTYNITAEMSYNNPPIVTISDIRTVRGKTVIFSATITDPENDNVASIFWDFGDGTNSTQLNPSHTYTVLDVYNCSVTVTDDGNVQPATTTKEFKVYVENQLPAITLLEPANLDYLASTTVQFSWSGSDPDVDFDTPYYYLYIDGQLAFEGYGETFTTELTAGEHTWYVVVTDGIDSVKSETRTLFVLTSPSKLTSVPVVTSAVITPYPAVVNDEVYIAYTAFDPDGKIVSGKIRVTDPSGQTLELTTSNVNNLWYGLFTPRSTGEHTITLMPVDDSGTSATLTIPLDVLPTPPLRENIIEVRKTSDTLFAVSKNAKILSSAKLYNDRLIVNADFSQTNATSVTLDLTSLDFSTISRLEFSPREGLSPLKQPVELKIKLPVKALVILNDRWNLIAEDYGVGSATFENGYTVISVKATDTVTFDLIKSPSWIQELIHRMFALIDSLLVRL